MEYADTIKKAKAETHKGKQQQKIFDCLKVLYELAKIESKILKYMKKLLLLALIVGSFSLFSFRNASDLKFTRNVENPNLYDIVPTTDYFTAYYREFPDKFVSARETWTKVSAIFSTGQLVVSENEMEELLEIL